MSNKSLDLASSISKNTDSSLNLLNTDGRDHATNENAHPLFPYGGLDYVTALYARVATLL